MKHLTEDEIKILNDFERKYLKKLRKLSNNKLIARYKNAGVKALDPHREEMFNVMWYEVERRKLSGDFRKMSNIWSRLDEL